MKKLLLILVSISIFVIWSVGEYKKIQEPNKIVKIEQVSTDNLYTVSKIYKATCTDVFDGDTITVRLDGVELKVRLVGIDTPELLKNGSIEFYSKDATEYTKKKLLNKKVYLERDISVKDKYDRYLYYVWINEPQSTVDENFIRDNLFNAMLVKNGYAYSYEYKPDTKYSKVLTALETTASKKQYGLWNVNAQNKWNALAEQQANSRNSDNNTNNNNDYVVEDISNSNAVYTQHYIGNRNTYKFHYPDCSSVGQMKESNKVWLNSREQAISYGYVPCGRCNP